MTYKFTIPKIINIVFFIILIIFPLGCSYNYDDIYVIKVFDGDTLELGNGEKVRFIGIDCPELYENDKLYYDIQRTGYDIGTMKEMGKKAYRFTRNLVEGKKVKLEFDIERRDKYRRLLAYVYLEDGTFINAKIIEQGYAQPMTIPPNVKYANLFQRLFIEAKEDNRGLWR